MADRIVGWQRVADPGACEFCNLVDGAFVKDADAMPLHNNCGCTLEPVVGDYPGDSPVPDGVAVNEHGELGPMLGDPAHDFTDESALEDAVAVAARWFWDDDEERVNIEPREAVPGWAESLTDDEKDGVRRYTTDGYKGLNEALRDGLELTAEQKRLKALLDSVIAKAGTYDDPVTVWRGVRFEYQGLPADIDLAFKSLAEREALTFESVASWAEQQFKPGEVLELGGMQSTSFQFLPALNASLSARSPGIIFEIRTKSGALLNEFTAFDDEAELLLRHETRYRVRRVLRRVKFADLDNEYERTVVQLEAI